MPIRTDAEILAAIDAEEALALDSQSGELQKQRTDALARYRGLPLGDEQEGRSQVVDKSVLDTIEWIMPSLVRIFLGGDEIGHFDAIGPEDEEGAKAETDACNWYLTAKNDTFSHINSTIRDALLLKNGYMAGQWRADKTVVTETYTGLAEEELALLMQDKCIKIVEHSDYPDPYYAAPPPGPPTSPPAPGPIAQPGGMGPPPMLSSMGGPAPPPGQMLSPAPPPMLHDVKLERTKADEFVGIESIPPEEMIVARRHRWTSLLDCDFVQWRRKTTIGQLRAEGFKVPDDAANFQDFAQESAERARFNEIERYSDETADPSRRAVQFKDTYMRIDLRGAGTPQLWRICRITDDDRILLKEEADLIPFAAFSPIIYPHSHIGSSVYDLIQDLSLIKTTLQRQFLDGVYQQHSNQKVVNVNAGVNLDDLMVTRPGNVIRCEGDPAQAVMPLQIADITSSVLQGLQYVDTIRRDRVGVDVTTAPLDPTALQAPITATHDVIVQTGAQAKIELIARTLAGGFKDLFLIIHALALKHSTKPLQMKLHGKWAMVNPREWATRTDFTITVGMGSGSPQQQSQKFVMMAPMVQQWMQLGLAGSQEVYNMSSDFIRALGWNLPDRYIHPPPIDPQTGQPAPPPQQPSPEEKVAQIRAQSEQQIKGMQLQADQQMAQMKTQLDIQESQADAQVSQAAEQAKAQADVAIQQHKVATSNQLEAEKFQRQLAADDVRHQREQQTQLQLANIKAASALEVARVSAGVDDGTIVLQQELRDAYGANTAALMTAMQAIVAHLQAAAGPREIMRGPDGRAIGIRASNGANQTRQ